MELYKEIEVFLKTFRFTDFAIEKKFSEVTSKKNIQDYRIATKPKITQTDRIERGEITISYNLDQYYTEVIEEMGLTDRFKDYQKSIGLA